MLELGDGLVGLKRWRPGVLADMGADSGDGLRVLVPPSRRPRLSSVLRRELLDLRVAPERPGVVVPEQPGARIRSPRWRR